MRGQGIAGNNHARHCTVTGKSTDVQIQNFFMGNNIICDIYCHSSSAAILCVLEMCFVSGI